MPSAWWEGAPVLGDSVCSGPFLQAQGRARPWGNESSHSLKLLGFAPSRRSGKGTRGLGSCEGPGDGGGCGSDLTAHVNPPHPLGLGLC